MQRRELLIGGGALVGLAALYGRLGASFAQSGKSQQATLEQRLADYALSVRYGALPPEVVVAAKHAILDTLACALGAVTLEPVVIAERTVRSTFGNGAATIIGYPRTASVEGAVFVNGVLVRSLDLNDTYIGTAAFHPSEVLPTALTLCEDGRKSGRDLIEAVVVGYEIGTRINDAISYLDRGFHPLSGASYAVPAIAGRLWGMSRDAIAHAVGLSGARGFTSFAVNSGAISMMKAMGLAGTAVDGIFSARLAAQGFTGPSGTLEWLATKMKPVKSDFALDLEPAHYRLPHVSFKRFPIQIELQAVAEAGSLLSPKIKGRVGNIRAITVETYPGIMERVADPAKFHPQTKGTADHSLPVCLAMALLDGDVTVAQFEKDRWKAPEVMALVEKTSVKPGEALMAKLPRGRGASVEISFTTGDTLRETVEIPEGDAQRPLSQQSLNRKFTTFAEPVVGSAKAARIVSLVDRLEEATDVQGLTALLKT